jgi:cytochrome c oxidase assembly factor CtaG
MAAVTPTFVIVCVGTVYLHGWIQRHVISAWRAGSFFLGLLAIWAAMLSPVAAWDSHMLTAHMIQHLLLMTIAPPLIWLGEPLIVTNPPRWLHARGLGRLLGHPAFCWLAAAAALVA